MRVRRVVLGVILTTRFFSSAAADPSPVAASLTPALTIAIPEFDFGTVPAGTVVEHEFVLENGSAAPVQVTRVRSSCGCTAGHVSAPEIAPGAKGTVQVRFDTTGRSGRQTKEVFISTAAVSTPVVCRLVGAVEGAAAAAATATLAPAAGATAAVTTPPPAKAPAAVPLPGSAPVALTSVPETVDFGHVWTHERPRREVTLTNTSSTRVRIREVTDGCGCLSSNLDRRELAPGESVTLGLVLHPDSGELDLQSTVSVVTDTPQAAPLRLRVAAQVRPQIVATPAELDLRDVPAGSTVERSIALESQDAIGLPRARVDCAVSGLQIELVPGASDRVATLRCRFTAPAEGGPVQGFVVLTTAPPQSTLKIRISGTVVGLGGRS
jgi:hypothetical protein